MSTPTVQPRYVQVSELLIRDIQAGRLLPGERMQPERSMAEGLGVSVGTLRKALDLMVEAGLVERVHGSGNYVRAVPERAGPYVFFRLELVSGGGRPSAEVLAVDTLDKPAGLPEFGTSERAHRIRRLRRLNGMPAALEEIWLDAGYAPALAARDLSESLYQFYKARLGLWIQRAEDRVGVAPVPDWGRGLPMRAGAPAGHVERISWDQNGARAEVSHTWFDAETTRYVTRLR